MADNDEIIVTTWEMITWEVRANIYDNNFRSDTGYC